MQNKTTKNAAYWIVGVVGIVLIILIVAQMRGQSQTKSAPVNSASATATTTTKQAAASAPATAKSTAASGKTPTGAASAGYQAELAIYQQNGYRIEISQCHGIPGKLTVPQGVKYMLDNRDNQAHTIKVGPNTYNLAPYGYEIVTAEILGINNITCDGGGAAQINIEK